MTLRMVLPSRAKRTTSLANSACLTPSSGVSDATPNLPGFLH